MHDIAETFPASVRDSYRKAADAFRFPYWDWHRPRGGEVTLSGATYKYDFSAPRIFTETQIMVKQASDNNLVPLKNPFAHFAFPKPDQGGLSANDFDLRKQLSRVETMRYPDQYDTTTALNASLNKNREPAVQNLIDMLTVPGIGYDKLNAFGWSGPTKGPSGSLEDSKQQLFYHCCDVSCPSADVLTS